MLHEGFHDPRTTITAAAIVIVAFLPFVGAQPPADERPAVAAPLTEVEIVRRVEAATDRSLDYLEKKQIKEGPRPGRGRRPTTPSMPWPSWPSCHRAMYPAEGKYGDTVAEGSVKPGVLTLARKFMLSTQAKDPARDGYLSLGGRMYDHGLATLALVELYGMDPDPEVESGVRRAVTLILRSQGPQGGWNYEPTAQDGDLSVSVMQIVALRAASNAEIPVPEAAIKKAITYVRQKANPAGGGYGYNGPGPGTVQTSAAGVLSLQLLGAHTDQQIPRTLDWIVASTKPTWLSNGTSYFYYFHYYAMQAFYQHGGKHWNEWHGPVREMLLAQQNKDGSWDVPAGSAEAAYASPTDKTYPTAFATLVLNIYQHYLPAYQR
ncbi:MAG: hypothetical protein U0840_30855 [Gemmataceae bacterium]